MNNNKTSQIIRDESNDQFNLVKKAQKEPKNTKARKGDKVRIWGFEPRPNKDRG